uniref:Retrovirus-related Pol polyprotein from transposon TNT 1-94 n=1 Tax=Tanacetum cinerariifolium TaxID=118510 RepID=A0A6L2L8R9_TANCI|nr:retrovirus-related Pol polyprotein from transposon TNT 1-94 [Tanacetum cinerariifolium]
MAFLSSPGSTNKVDTSNIQVSTVSTPISTVSSHDNTTNLSDETMNQESKPRNQDSSRKTVNVKDTYSKAMVAIDGAGFDWSYMADDEVPTNMALMAFSDSEKPEQANQPRKVSKIPRNNITNWNEISTHKLGVGFQFTKKACFVCGSFSHLIKDYDFYNKKMVQKFVLQNVEKGTVQREVRPVWNNAMRINHQNFSNSRRNFAPTAVLTKSKIVPISTARQSSSRASAPVSAARPINIVASKPLVNVAIPRQNALQKSHSLSRIPFYQQTALKNRNLNNNVNTAKANSVNTAKGNKVASAVGKQRINAVKSLACWVWRPKIKKIYPTSLTLKSMMVGMLPLGDELKVVRLLAKAQSEVAEAFNTACYVQNKVLVVKPYFKTPYELFKGRSPSLSFMRPFRCHVTILNTLDQLGKFDRKSDEGIFVGYSLISKAFKVYNITTRKVEENLHNTFLENKPMIVGGRPEWLFDIDALLKLMNYAPVLACTNFNDFTDNSLFDSSSQASDGHNKDKHGPSQAKDAGIFDDAYDDRDEGTKADYNNLEIVISVSPIPSTRIHKDHPKEQIIEEMEPKKVTQALDDESWVEAMPKELLQFKLLNVWTLVDLPHGKRAIGNKRDQRGIVVRNKARLVAQGASLDRKSTTGGCRFLSSMLISWQCKKQTIVANSKTKEEYIAASNCCGQVLWLQT